LAREQDAPPRTRYGPAYQLVKEHLIYRNGAERPRTLLEASRNGHIEVATDSPHAATLARLRVNSPDLSWVENPDAEVDQLLYRLSRREFDYTIADSNEFAIGRSFHPDIAIAFNLTQGKSIAWLVNSRDSTLLSRVTSFFSVIESDGRLAAVLKNYYGKKSSAPVFQAHNFMMDVRERLHLYVDWFKAAASEVGIDWRMLAAIGYQESKWQPEATSPTGVRGLMMLTDDTARSLGVVDRLHPRDSIFGGARYFIHVREMIPARIKEPDRTWFALASYNMGFGHIEDARVFAQADGKNPDKWDVVREYLPLLTQERWYSQAKRGYARGWEPVQFVDSIKLYMTMMDWVGAQGGLADTMQKVDANKKAAR
jgi:membrane-bound lytic murein transglycosylase F